MAKIVFIHGEQPAERGAERRRLRQLVPLLEAMGHEVAVENVWRGRKPHEIFTPNYAVTRVCRAGSDEEAFRILDEYDRMYAENELTSRNILEKHAAAHPDAHIFSLHAMAHPGWRTGISAVPKAPPHVMVITGYAQPHDEARMDSNLSALIMRHSPRRPVGKNSMAIIEIVAPVATNPNAGALAKGGILKFKAARDKWAAARAGKKRQVHLTADVMQYINWYAGKSQYLRIPPGSHYDHPAHAQALAAKIHELVTEAEGLNTGG